LNNYGIIADEKLHPLFDDIAVQLSKLNEIGSLKYS